MPFSTHLHLLHATYSAVSAGLGLIISTSINKFLLDFKCFCVTRTKVTTTFIVIDGRAVRCSKHILLYIIMLNAYCNCWIGTRYQYIYIPYYKIQQMASKEAYHLKGTQLNCNFAVNKLPSNVCTLFYIPRWVSTRKMYIVSGSPGTRIVIEIPLRYKRSLSPEKNQTNH